MICAYLTFRNVIHLIIWVLTIIRVGAFTPTQRSVSTADPGVFCSQHLVHVPAPRGTHQRNFLHQLDLVLKMTIEVHCKTFGGNPSTFG